MDSGGDPEIDPKVCAMLVLMVEFPPSVFIFMKYGFSDIY